MKVGVAPAEQVTIITRRLIRVLCAICLITMENNVDLKNQEMEGTMAARAALKEKLAKARDDGEQEEGERSHVFFCLFDVGCGVRSATSVLFRKGTVSKDESLLFFPSISRMNCKQSPRFVFFTI